jgi:hypothetical protein
MMDKRYFIQRQPAGDSKRSAEQLIGGLKAAVVGTHAEAMLKQYQPSHSTALTISTSRISY